MLYKVEIFQDDKSYYNYKMTKKETNLLEKAINSRRCKYINFIDGNSMLFIPKSTIEKIIITKVGA